MHWSDVMAQRLAQRGDKHIVATGITPSGEFHIGHLREILTGDMIARAARRAAPGRGRDHGAELLLPLAARGRPRPAGLGVAAAPAPRRDLC